MATKKSVRKAPATRKSSSATRTKKTTAKKSTKKVARKKTATKKTVPRKRAAAAAPRKKVAKKVAKRTTTKKVARKTATAPISASARRTIFIDVENTSHEAELVAALERLGVDRSDQRTEVIGVGNWRLVGQRLGRRLASFGAQLVHSAPVSGVRDWSDLWIAVSAGMRLAEAKPGDVLEIVSNDRAFDAVGDAAASLGVVFQRVVVSTSRSTVEPAERKTTRRRRRGSRGGAKKAAAQSRSTAAASEPAAKETPATSAPAGATEEPHTATHEQIVAVLERLSGGDATRWVNLDVLENALKKDGFARPPGSPRLVTRLRRLQDIEISPHGAVRVKHDL